MSDAKGERTTSSHLESSEEYGVLDYDDDKWRFKQFEGHERIQDEIAMYDAVVRVFVPTRKWNYSDFDNVGWSIACPPFALTGLGAVRD